MNNDLRNLHWRAEDEDDYLERASDLFLLENEDPPEPYIPEESPADLEEPLQSQVAEFETAWKEVRLLTVHEILGEPPFFPADSLTPEQLLQELERIRNIFARHNMTVEIPEGTAPQLAYRFLTEYLFRQEIDDLKMEGLTRRFIFNDAFHSPGLLT